MKNGNFGFGFCMMALALVVVLSGCESRKNQVGYIQSDPFAPQYGADAGAATTTATPAPTTSTTPAATAATNPSSFGGIGGVVQPPNEPPKAGAGDAIGVHASRIWAKLAWVAGAVLWLVAFFVLFARGAWEARKLPFAVVMACLLLFLIWAGHRLMSG